MTDETEDTGLHMKALVLNGQIIGQLNEKGMEMYVEKLQEFKDELDGVDGEEQ